MISIKRTTKIHLIIIDLDLLVDLVLHEAVEHSAVDLAEELAGVERVLGDDHEAVVVNDVALDLGAVAGQGTSL